jgi:hypothetical protein
METWKIRKMKNNTHPPPSLQTTPTYFITKLEKKTRNYHLFQARKTNWEALENCRNNASLTGTILRSLWKCISFLTLFLTNVYSYPIFHAILEICVHSHTLFYFLVVYTAYPTLSFFIKRNITSVKRERAECNSCKVGSMYARHNGRTLVVLIYTMDGVVRCVFHAF